MGSEITKKPTFSDRRELIVDQISDLRQVAQPSPSHGRMSRKRSGTKNPTFFMTAIEASRRSLAQKVDLRLRGAAIPHVRSPLGLMFNLAQKVDPFDSPVFNRSSV